MDLTNIATEDLVRAKKMNGLNKLSDEELFSLAKKRKAILDSELTGQMSSGFLFAYAFVVLILGFYITGSLSEKHEVFASSCSVLTILWGVSLIFKAERIGSKEWEKEQLSKTFDLG